MSRNIVRIVSSQRSDTYIYFTPEDHFFHYKNDIPHSKNEKSEPEKSDVSFFICFLPNFSHNSRKYFLKNIYIYISYNSIWTTRRINTKQTHNIELNENVPEEPRLGKCPVIG